jgi:hypothetical protein
MYAATVQEISHLTSYFRGRLVIRCAGCRLTTIGGSFLIFEGAVAEMHQVPHQIRAVYIEAGTRSAQNEEA